MTKKHFIAHFLCLIQLILIPFIVLGNPKNEPLDADFCEMPAPDSFRVVSRGPNFIDLAWNPIGPLSTHTLTIFTRSQTDTWMFFGTFTDLTGGAFTVNDIAFDVECKFSLATNCSLGEPSSKQAEILDKIIIEVTTGGRIPINPTPLACSNINFSTYNWTGFRVAKKLGDTTESNLFEFSISNELGVRKIKIKRVFDNSIVAVDKDRHWPDDIDSALKAPNPFKMYQIIEKAPLQYIGSIDIRLYFLLPVVDICKAQNAPPWNDIYTFTPMVANTAIDGELKHTNSQDNGYIVGHMLNNAKRIEVNNPFHETLNIKTAKLYQNEETATIRLLNTSGKNILEQKVVVGLGEISIPVRSISPGFYILQIETRKEVFSLKILKVE